jgi:hypothetical protein
MGDVKMKEQKSAVRLGIFIALTALDLDKGNIGFLNYITNDDSDIETMIRISNGENSVEKVEEKIKKYLGTLIK